MGREVPFDKVIVSMVPSVFQETFPKAPAPSRNEWPLLRAIIELILAAVIAGLLVGEAKVRTTVSPASIAEVPPVFFAIALTKPLPVTGGTTTGGTDGGAPAVIVAVVIAVTVGELADVLIPLAGKLTVILSAEDVTLLQVGAVFTTTKIDGYPG